MLTVFAAVGYAADENKFSSGLFTLGNNTLPYRQAEICHGDSKPALVLYLHGGTSRGDDNEKQLNEAAVGVIYDYLLDHGIASTMIVPQCPSGGGWTSTLRRVVNELLKSYIDAGKADSCRVYVLGGSMGGTGTWCQLGNYPNFYAGAMPVAGNPTGMNAANVATTPVYTVMGTADNIMSIDAVEAFRAEVLAAGGTLILDVETGWTHQNTCEQSYTESRLDWLFSQKRSTSTLTGDVNGDGLVNTADVSALYRYILDGYQTFSEICDVNNDGEVNTADVSAIYRIILGVEFFNRGGFRDGTRSAWCRSGTSGRPR